MRPAIVARPGDLIRAVAVTAAEVCRDRFSYRFLTLEVEKKCRACHSANLRNDSAVCDERVIHFCDGVPMPAYSLTTFRFRQSLILSDDFNAAVPQFRLVHRDECFPGFRSFFCQCLTERYRSRLFVKDEICRLYRKSFSRLNRKNAARVVVVDLADINLAISFPCDDSCSKNFVQRRTPLLVRLLEVMECKEGTARGVLRDNFSVKLLKRPPCIRIFN